MQIWLQIGELFARISMGAILNSLWEGFALAVVAWLALRAVPRANASLRYALWCVALVGVLALPVIAIHASSTPAVTAAAGPAVAVPQRLAQIMFALWYVVATILVLRLTGSYIRLQQLKGSASPMPPLYQHRVRRWLQASGGRRACRLCVSDQVPMPVAIGLFDPVIVLPERLIEQLSDEEFDQIGLHELAHLQRWDDYTNVFQKLVEALLFFNPAVYMIGRQLTLEREIACDDRVIAATGKPLTYAWCLTRLVEATALTRQALPALGALSTRRQFAIRIERLLEKRRAGFSLASRVTAAVACVVIAVALFAAARVGPLVAITRDSEESAQPLVAVAQAVHAPKQIAIIVALPRHAAVSTAVTAAKGPLAFVQSVIAKIGRTAAVARSNAVGARNFTYAYKIIAHRPYAGGRIRVYELDKVQVVTPAAAPHAHTALPDGTMVAQIAQMDVWVNDVGGHATHVHVRVSPDLAKAASASAAASRSYANDSQTTAPQIDAGPAEVTPPDLSADVSVSTLAAELRVERSATAREALVERLQDHVEAVEARLALLDAMLHDASPSVKLVAVQALAGDADRQEVQAALLTGLRSSQSTRVKLAIIYSLAGRLHYTLIRDGLAEVFSDGQPEAVQLAAAGALASLAEEPYGQATLLRALGNTSFTRVKLNIIEALTAKIQEPDVRKALQAALGSDQPMAVQLAAIQALAPAADDPEVRAALEQAGGTGCDVVRLSIKHALSQRQSP